MALVIGLRTTQIMIEERHQLILEEKCKCKEFDKILQVSHSQTWQTLNGNWTKKMFYLMTHSAHFIFGYMTSGVWQRTTSIERGETCCHNSRAYFRLAARNLLYTPPIVCVTPVVKHWLEREIAHWVHYEGSIQWPITPWAQPLPLSYISLHSWCLYVAAAVWHCSLFEGKGRKCFI